MEQTNMRLSKLQQQLRKTRESISKINNNQGNISELPDLQVREIDLLDRISEIINEETQNKSGKPNEVIPYVGCNDCRTEIDSSKYRRRCTECEDYDICNQCFEEYGHEHPTYEERYTNIIHQRLINLKTSMAERFESAFLVFWRRPCLGWRPQPGSPYTWIKFAEVYRQCMCIGHGLRKDLGLSKGDAIAIHSHNRIEWVFADLGGAMNGLIVVPIHHAISDLSQLSHILRNCHVKVVICEAEFSHKFLNVKGECPDLRAVVELPLQPSVEVNKETPAANNSTGNSGKFFFQFSEFQEKRGKLWDPSLMEKPPLQDGEIIVREPLDIATIIHTSGSTGKPKGAPFTDRMCINAMNNSWAKDRDPYVEAAMDPLAYISGREHLHSVLVQGGRVGFTTTATVFEDLREIGPFSLACTPRFWNVLHSKFRQAVLLEIAQTNATSEKDISAAREKVKKEFRYCLGTRLHYVGVGGAGVSPTLLQFMKEVFGETSVADGYGSTEAGSIAGRNGVLAKGVEIKLEDVPDLGYFSTDKPYPRGLLWVKTNDMVSGYYNDPDESAKAFADGWFCTGDIVEQIRDRQIKIIDRRKNFFKLSQGEFVAAEKLENLYLQSPFIDQTFVTCGDISMFEQTSIFCVVVPNYDTIKQLWKDLSSQNATDSCPSISELCENESVKNKVLEELHKFGSSVQLAPYELPGNIILEPEPFTIENGKMTASNKLARPVLEKIYSEKINQVLAAKQPMKEEQELNSLLCELLNLGGATELKSASLSSLGTDSLSAVKLSSLLKFKMNLDIPPHLLLDPQLSLAKLQDLIKTGSTTKEENRKTLQEQIEHDLVLDPAISVTAPYTNLTNCILVTGCTGFVGAFLLKELLETTSATIYALIRTSTDDESPLARLQNILTTLRIWDSLQETHKNRIVALAGDLEKESFGLSTAEYTTLGQKIDIVYHCAAGVNHILPYHQLRKQNVLSTLSILSFCAIKPARLNYTSTISAVPNVPPGSSYDNLMRYICHDMGGYEQTKYVAERLVENAITWRGLKGSIVRLGLVSWDTRTGASNERDWFTRLMTGIIFIGQGPAENIKFEFMHVDHVCDILCKLGMQEGTCGEIFNVFNERLTALHDLLTVANVHEVQTTEWWQTIHEQIKSISYQKYPEKVKSGKVKVVESLLLFQSGLPNDEKWVNKAKVLPNFNRFYPSAPPKQENINLFIEFLCQRLQDMS